MATTRQKKDDTATFESADIQMTMKTRTAPVSARLNFEIPADLLRGIKVAAALGDTTIKVTVIQIIDEWLRTHPEYSSFTYKGVDLASE
jgi:hypothetical protein